jgi:4-hydroxy 2-oxovalerate aldolase
MRYLELAHRNLNPDIALGYHGHNNLMQAYGVAEAFVERLFERDILIDGSVFGIGRGAGNLNIELFAKYLNENHGKRYRIDPFLEIYEKYLKLINEKSPWGYSLPLFLTGLHRCNPLYGTYYGYDLGLDAVAIDAILKNITTDDKIRFQQEVADRYLAEYQTKTGVLIGTNI